MTQKANISISVFLRFCTKTLFCISFIFAFCVITFEPVKIATLSAHQNDRLYLSFVKDIYAVGKTLARNGRKMAICQLQILMISLYIMKVQKCKFPTPSLCYFVQCMCVS